MKLMELIKALKFSPENKKILDAVLRVGDDMQDSVYEDLTVAENMMRKSKNTKALALTSKFRKKFADAYGDYTTQLHELLKNGSAK